ncbi:MAG: flavocytochrome c [Holophaga sp.]|nr:flavocytochrome c [Holophaga sp.]
MKNPKNQGDTQNPGEAQGSDRRDFLKKSLAMGLAATAAGTFALNLGAAPADAPSRKKLPTKWDESYDVVIIGSGFAGLAAAAEAAGKGASVVILEKMPVYGGNSIINGGEYNAWTDELHLREKFNLGDDSAQIHKDDTLKGGDNYGSPELVEILTAEAPNALNWMIDEGGLQLRQVLNRTGGHSKYRTHTCVEGVGRGYTEALRKIAEKRGAKIRLKSKVSWLWRRDVDSPVLGVELESARGPVNIRARKGVILASGGFGRDVAMRMVYNPSLNGGYNCTNQKGATGEVIRYAQAVGAEAIQMAFIQLYPYADPETGILDAPAVYPFRGPGYGIVYVDQKAKRFVNEMERRDVVSRAEMLTGGKKTFSIFNEAMAIKMGNKEEVERAVANGRFVRADTLEALAGKLGLDAATLKDTISKHNGYLKAKLDPEFGRSFTPQMISLEEGPYYAIAQWPAVHHTMGGLRTNKFAQVLDIWSKPIPHLYAAGEVTGGIHGANRLGGNAGPDATVFGRIAGIKAASEKA